MHSAYARHGGGELADATCLPVGDGVMAAATIARTLPSSDGLLTAARGLVIVLMALCCVIGAGLCLAIGGVPLFNRELLAKLAEQAGHPVGAEALSALVAILIVLFAVVVTAFLWLRQLRRIIDSVGIGDPFNPVNAERLARMGWLTVMIELVAIPGSGLASYLARLLHQVRIDVGASLGGVLLALVLFILARVFRVGATMRADLDGTV